MKAIMNAEEAYSIKNDGKYTETLTDLADTSKGNDFLKAVPKCPLGGSYKYTPATASAQATVEGVKGSHNQPYDNFRCLR